MLISWITTEVDSILIDEVRDGISHGESKGIYPGIQHSTKKDSRPALNKNMRKIMISFPKTSKYGLVS